jgi:hypothetical protein
VDVVLGQRLIDLRERVASNFDASNWEEIGLLIGHSNIINTLPTVD